MNQELFKELLLEEFKKSELPQAYTLYTLFEANRDLYPFNHYMEQYEFEPKNWFPNFCKSIRQCGFFDDMFAYKRINKLTEEQTIRRNEILRKREEDRKTYCPNNSDEEFAALKLMPGYKEELDELRGLNSIMQSEEEIRICGIFDTVLYNIVNYDDGKIQKLFEKVFRMYAFELKELEIKS